MLQYTRDMIYVCDFFFFKQKTAYEMSASLVGSEMCIRDRWTTGVSTTGMRWLEQAEDNKEEVRE